MSNKILVYTCILGRKDRLHAVPPSDHVEFHCFTDDYQGTEALFGWKLHVVEPGAMSARMQSRRVKWLPWDYLQDLGRLCVWIDGNVVVNDPSFAFDACEELRQGVAHPLHPKRDNVRDEITAARKRRSHLRSVPIEDQIEHYEGLGYNGKLLHGKVIARDIGEEVCRVASASVWGQLVKWGHDCDQVVMPYMYDAHGVIPGVLPDPRRWPGRKIHVVSHAR